MIPQGEGRSGKSKPQLYQCEHAALISNSGVQSLIIYLRYLFNPF
jgi:hypothetical protein